jgi:hypothetical protein
LLSGHVIGPSEPNSLRHAKQASSNFSNEHFFRVNSFNINYFGRIKNRDPIKIDQISARVTQKVEKSNFYTDLEGVMEWKDTVKNTANGKK